MEYHFLNNGPNIKKQESNVKESLGTFNRCNAASSRLKYIWKYWTSDTSLLRDCKCCSKTHNGKEKEIDSILKSSEHNFAFEL